MTRRPEVKLAQARVITLSTLIFSNVSASDSQVCKGVSMRFIRVFFVIVSLCFSPASSQDMPSDVHQSTLVPPTARFQIVQSEIAARWTFKFDRFTGQIWQIVTNASGDNLWEEMSVVGLPSIRSPLRPRFQLFLSGIAARWTLMIDTDTGSTWQLQKTTNKNAAGPDTDVYSWQPIL